MLARGLDQLHTSLEALDNRLRRAVAEAVAESLGGWIRDVFLKAVDGFAGRPAERERQLLPHRRWDEPLQMTERDDRDEGAFSPHVLESDEAPERYEEPEPYDQRPSPPAQPSSDRLALSLAAGLQAAAWCLRRSDRRRNLPSVGGVALLVGLAVLAAPLLTTSAFRLAALAGQLEALTDATGFNLSHRPVFDSV
jgi:hypothetical protein